MFVSDAILQETLRVLRDRFGFSDERLADAEAYINGCAERVKPSETLDVVKEDPDGNRVLECAQAAGCEAIITGDLDLVRLGRYGAIRMMTVREFLDRGSERAAEARSCSDPRDDRFSGSRSKWGADLILVRA